MAAVDTNPSNYSSFNNSSIFSGDATPGGTHWTRCVGTRTPENELPPAQLLENLSSNQDAFGLPHVNSTIGVVEDEKKGTKFSAVVNLLATAMGAGLLSLPKAFAHCGILTGVLMLLLIGWSVDCTLQYLVVVSRVTRIENYEGNAERYFGKWGRRTINVLLLVLLFLATVAMLVIIMGLLSEFIQETSGQPKAVFGSPFFVGAAALVFIFPFALLEKITLLKYTSIAAICNLCYYFTCLNVKFFSRTDTPLVHETTVYHNGDVLSQMQGFSIMVAAFLCHFNIFPIYSELARPLKEEIWSVIHIAIPGIATTVYVVGGLLGYLFFGAMVKNNMLEQFPNDAAMSVARLALSLTNLFKIPLMVQPLRLSIREALPRDWPRHKVIETLVLFILVYISAASLQSLSKVLGLLGCTVGVAVSLVMPALLRLKHRDMISEAENSRLHNATARCGAYCIAIFGTIFSIGSLIAIVVRWDEQ